MDFLAQLEAALAVAHQMKHAEVQLHAQLPGQVHLAVQVTWLL